MYVLVFHGPLGSGGGERDGNRLSLWRTRLWSSPLRATQVHLLPALELTGEKHHLINHTHDVILVLTLTLFINNYNKRKSSTDIRLG